VRERLLLFRVGSGTDWQRAGVTGETVTALVAKGLLVRDGAGRFTLTDDGRAALQALLPGLLVLTLPRLSCWEEIDMALGTVNKLIGNAIELAGIGLALVGIAVASYQCVLRLQDGDWMPLEFRLARAALKGSGRRSLIYRWQSACFCVAAWPYIWAERSSSRPKPPSGPRARSRPKGEILFIERLPD
jgi:hypothetical protein